MKKVLALVLAVMMVSTVAFAATVKNHDKRSNISPAGGVKFTQDGIDKPGSVVSLTVGGTTNEASTTLNFETKVVGAPVVEAETGAGAKDSGTVIDVTTGQGLTDKTALETLINGGSAATNNGFNGRYINTLSDMIFRSITNENYTVTSLKVVTGKAYVAGVSIVDSEEALKVNFVKDLDNVTPKDFDLSFTLKGKGKMIIRDWEEALKYYDFVRPSNPKRPKDTASIPTVKFRMSGKVGYGKVTVDLGEFNDEDLDGLQDRTTTNGSPIDLENDVIKFGYGGTFGEAERSSQVGRAGSFVADAILTEEYDEGLTMEARVYSGDTLYLYVDNSPKPYVDTLDTGDGDVDFYFFDTNAKYTTLNTNAKLIFNDTEEGDYVYQFSNNKLTPVGEYDEDEGCIVVRARKLGQYITSDVELSWLDIATSDDVQNPDTGANDVVGIAAALAAVALVSAAAVSLKK